jgi:hypothetical protein
MFEIPGESGRALPDLQQPLCAIGALYSITSTKRSVPLDKVLPPTGEDELVLI